MDEVRRPEMLTDALWPGTYSELRRLASRHIRRQAHRTLSTTTLVHESYLRLARSERLEIADSEHLIRTASRAMRWVLVDEVRERLQKKRGGGWMRVDLERATDSAVADAHDAQQALLVAEAIKKLAEVDERSAKVVTLRALGMRVDEIALELGVSVRTVAREWNHAVSWLNRELADSTA